MRLIDPVPFRLAEGQRFIAAPVDLDPLTDSIELRMRRPSTAAPLEWSAGSRVRTRIVLLADGGEFVFEGSASGGIRLNRNGEADQYVLRIRPTTGARRFGEGRSGYRVRVEIDGGPIESEIELSATASAAPVLNSHRSVAFDAATDISELSGDGVVSLTHTAGGSDRAAFAFTANSSGAGGENVTSVTYAGSNMTEVWDNLYGAFYGSAGHWILPGTGAQTVTSSLATPQDEHFLAVISMTGVHQTTSVGTNAFVSGTTSPLVTSVGSVDVFDMVCAGVYIDGTVGAAGPGLVQRTTETLGTVTALSYTQTGDFIGKLSHDFTPGEASLGALVFKSADAPTPDAATPQGGPRRYASIRNRLFIHGQWW